MKKVDNKNNLIVGNPKGRSQRELKKIVKQCSVAYFFILDQLKEIVM